MDGRDALSVAAVLVYSRELSAVEVEAVEDYLGEMYGITVQHLPPEPGAYRSAPLLTPACREWRERFTACLLS